jgi:hypothetical protein
MPIQGALTPLKPGKGYAASEKMSYSLAWDYGCAVAVVVAVVAVHLHRADLDLDAGRRSWSWAEGKRSGIWVPGRRSWIWVAAAGGDMVGAEGERTRATRGARVRTEGESESGGGNG